MRRRHEPRGALLGDNSSGQLGNGTNQASATPFGLGFDASDLAAGDQHTCAVADDGRVRCWGNNASGQLGDGTTGDPIEGSKAIGRTSVITTQGVEGAVAVRAGLAHSCALLGSGELRCWGANQFGLLGHGGDLSEVTVTAQPATLLAPKLLRIAFANDHACAISGAGEGIVCWGANNYGQLGRGTQESQFDSANVESTRPAPVIGFAGCK